jgi:hypothetical protein
MGHPDVRWSIVSSYSLHSRHLLSISSFRVSFKVVCADSLILSCHNCTFYYYYYYFIIIITTTTTIIIIIIITTILHVTCPCARVKP